MRLVYKYFVTALCQKKSPTFPISLYFSLPLSISTCEWNSKLQDKIEKIDLDVSGNPKKEGEKSCNKKFAGCTWLKLEWASSLRSREPDLPELLHRFDINYPQDGRDRHDNNDDGDGDGNYDT